MDGKFLMYIIVSHPCFLLTMDEQVRNDDPGRGLHKLSLLNTLGVISDSFLWRSVSWICGDTHLLKYSCLV